MAHYLANSGLHLLDKTARGHKHGQFCKIYAVIFRNSAGSDETCRYAGITKSIWETLSKSLLAEHISVIYEPNKVN